jgi:hypothetical protein
MPTRIVLVLALVFAGSIARAQDAGQVGIAMGYPESVAVLWHVTDRVAVRPELSFRSSHNEGGGSSLGTVASSTSDSSFVGVGASGLFYVARWDALRAYVSPRVAFSRSHSTSEITIALPPFPVTVGGLTPTTTTQTIIGHTVGADGSFGAQYAFHARFSAYGEVGFGYSRSTGSETPASPVTFVLPTTSGWGTRSAVGVIFYF